MQMLVPTKLVCAACSILFICSFSPTAIACRGPTLERTIFFDEAPNALDVEVILQITIIKLIGTATESAFTKPDDNRFSFVGLAHVDRVIKGVINSDTITIRAPNSSCDHPFSVGSSGIVAGTLVVDGSGSMKLLAKSESEDERQERKRSRTR